MDLFRKSVKQILTQSLPRNIKDAEHKFVLTKHLELIDRFIDDVVIPLSKPPEETTETTDPMSFLNKDKEKDLTNEKIPLYFSTYREGMNALSCNEKTPFSPFDITDEDVKEVVYYLKDVKLEDYYRHNRVFMQNCYVVITTWCRDAVLKHRLENIYSKYPAYEWHEKVRKDMELNFITDDVKILMERLQKFGHMNF